MSGGGNRKEGTTTGGGGSGSGSKPEEFSVDYPLYRSFWRLQKYALQQDKAVKGADAKETWVALLGDVDKVRCGAAWCCAVQWGVVGWGGGFAEFCVLCGAFWYGVVAVL